MNKTDLCYLPAGDVLDLFRRRTLSPVEYLEALIARADQVEPRINAFAHTRYDEAMEAARLAEARYAGGETPRPLEGLPVAIKDEMDVAGQPMTNGSLYLRGNVSTETHFAVQRLLDAGAIIHARTTTPEFSCCAITDSTLNGSTRTPWDLRFTSGGSSGGSGAALAAGSTPLAVGSDIGGSIRFPAACCGVVGYKPPHGRNPDNTAYAYDMYGAMGPMTRTVGDAILLQNILSGPHPADLSSVRPKYDLPVEEGDIRGLRIGWTMDMGFFEIDDHVRANTERTLGVLQDLGAELVEVDFGWTAEADEAVKTYLGHLFNGFMRPYHDSDPSLATPWMRYCMEAHDQTTAEAFVASFDVQTQMAHRIGPILENVHTLVCPTLGFHEVPADHHPDDPIRINGKVVDPLYGWGLCHPFNMLGRLPVLAVPSGIGGNGLPTGIQIVARHFDDERVFRVGRALERAQPWLDCPARRPSI